MSIKNYRAATKKRLCHLSPDDNTNAVDINTSRREMELIMTSVTCCWFVSHLQVIVFYVQCCHLLKKPRNWFIWKHRTDLYGSNAYKRKYVMNLKKKYKSVLRYRNANRRHSLNISCYIYKMKWCKVSYLTCCSIYSIYIVRPGINAELAFVESRLYSDHTAVTSH